MKNYIFDLGFHNGDDTDYYLKKGYNVVAVEGNPQLYEQGCKRFSKDITDKKLFLYNNVISDKKEPIPFYIHPFNLDWSSCTRNKVEWDGSTATEVIITPMNLYDLYKIYGVPYYIKTDIEGNDTILAKELYDRIVAFRPKYVSFELARKDYYIIFSYLYVAGYTKFQLVNQANNNGKVDTQINYTFTKFSSGMFGEDLPQHKWASFDETLTNYMKYKELKAIDNQELALGWVDIHATI